MSLKAVQTLSPTLKIEVAADDPKDLIKELAFFAELPKACPVCGAAVSFFYRSPQQYHYYGLVCDGKGATTQRHESTFGQHRDGGGLFYKRSEPWEEVRRGRDSDDEEYAAEPEPPRHQQAVRNGERANAYAYETGGRQPSQRAQEPRDLQMQGAPAPLVCSTDGCSKTLTRGQHDISVRTFGQPFCPQCQTAHRRPVA